MSPLSLYYTTADIVDDFIRDTMHLFGRVTVKSTVTKKALDAGFLSVSEPKVMALCITQHWFELKIRLIRISCSQLLAI